MVVSVVRKVGDDLVVVIPPDEAERHGLREGSLVELVPRPADAEPALAEDLARIVDQDWERMLPGLKYLADR